MSTMTRPSRITQQPTRTSKMTFVLTGEQSVEVSSVLKLKAWLSTTLVQFQGPVLN